MRKLSLLLIEGDPDIRSVIAGTLRARYGDAHVDAAAMLRDALSLSPASRDLVLTEWKLPDAVGKNILDSLRTAGSGAVIVVTEANIAAVAAEAVLSGAVDYVVRHRDYLVTLPLVIEKNLAVDKLRRERDALHRQLREQNETLEQLLKSLAEAAATDPLTGLYNRRHFAAVLEQMYADSLRGNSDLSCVMLDMDGFKQLNDTLGHQAGDAALASAALTIKDCLRKMDAAARYGGDEFVILLPRTSSLDAAIVARRIRSCYTEDMRAKGFTRVPLGISFGVASLHADQPRSGDALVAAADAALYQAKRLGRDRVVVSGSAIPGLIDVPRVAG